MERLFRHFGSIGICLLSVCMLGSCAKESESNDLVDLVNVESQAIQEYIKNHQKDSGFLMHPSGIVYKIKQPGVQDTTRIQAHQVALLRFENRQMGSKSLVQSSQNLPTDFDRRKLKDHIMGWQIALPLIPKKSKILIYIPSVYAYGSVGVPGFIAPNAIIESEVELLDFYD
jgi:FKBP-type peptidyl-prolyl cis-trans isomerase FkpA